MITLTKEWLQLRIAELEEERDATPGVVNEDAAMALAAMKLALASLEAEAVAWRMRYRSVHCIGGWVFSDTYGEPPKGYEIESLYTVPPAPVSVPDEDTPDNIQMLASTFAPCGVTYQWDRDECNAAADSWNACRAAMLQGAETVTTAYKLRDAVETIRNSGIEIDAEKIFAERDALNAPDCWCRTCRPITLTDMRFVVCPDCGNKRCPHANDHRNACTGSNEPGQEGSAYPAAPQQEVK
ncbi:hypothetical protein M2O49_004334 [Citrobacter amalonaticus]|nr:hypothetical protein [Citrobacter amalonaticus]